MIKNFFALTVIISVCMILSSVLFGQSDITVISPYSSKISDYTFQSRSYIDSPTPVMSLQSSQIYVKGYGFNTTSTLQNNDTQFAGNAAVLNTAEALRVIMPPLCYPSPMRASLGGQLQFALSRNAPIQIKIFDMMANAVFDKVFPAGGAIGSAGINRLTIDQALIGNRLASGVYIILLVHQGEVLAKTKVAVIP